MNNKEKIIAFMEWKRYELKCQEYFTADDELDILNMDDELINKIIEKFYKIALWGEVPGDSDICPYCIIYYDFGSQDSCEGCPWGERHGRCYDTITLEPTGLYYEITKLNSIVKQIGTEMIIDKIKEILNNGEKKKKR